MCNHYHAHLDSIRHLEAWKAFVETYDEADLTEAADDMWPRRQGIVARKENGRSVIEAMQWGVPLKLPGKREGTTITKRVTNVRNLNSPFWRSMLAKPEQRCLVPFSRFAEPKIGQGREEHWFTVKGREVAAFAGLWRPSEEGLVYAFLTCAPNELVKPLHPKAMPVILHEDDYEKWLTGSKDEAVALAEPYPSQLMSVE